MKNNTFIKELAASLVVVILAIMLIDPLQLWMPSTAQMTILVFLMLAFVVFAAFVWKERGQDEREQLHIMYAGRMAFLVGAGILIVGIMYQSFQHSLDPWLVIALVVMVIAKIGGRIGAQINK